VLRPGYDEAALLSQMDVWLQQPAAPTALLDPATADQHAVTGIEYNARGQRLSISFGNGTGTDYGYDPQTFRLTNLTTTRPGTFLSNQQTVQDLAYYYDPVGNVTQIADDADTQDVIFFRNQRVDPSASYWYDPLYRLITATGREHVGQTGAGDLAPPQQITNDDSFRTGLPWPGEGKAMGKYTETYTYDAAGNILSMGHRVGSAGWTRWYTYAETSQIVAAETGNRLSTTSLPGDLASGPYTGLYQHDAHGNMTLMPHLATLTWDEDDRLRSTARQPGTQATFYAYNGGGQRVRKVTDWQSPAPQATAKTERIYLGAIEIYREYANDGTTITLSRETLHVADGEKAIVLVETRTAGSDKAPVQLMRYQFGNHLGSALLELDDQSNIITYEEYFPFGSTSYQAVASQTDLAKRYRYTGKERDEENDLYYHGARYYAPWLGRWISCDPAGLADGPDAYVYARNNPVRMRDPDGRQTTDQASDKKGQDAAPARQQPTLTEAEKRYLKNVEAAGQEVAKAWEQLRQDSLAYEDFEAATKGMPDEDPYLWAYSHKIPGDIARLKEATGELFRNLFELPAAEKPVPEEKEPVTLGFDAVVGGPTIPIVHGSGQGGFDTRQLNILPRNWVIGPRGQVLGLDVATLKEPSLQLQIEKLRNQAGTAWNMHYSIAGNIDLLNASHGHDPWEVAISGGGGYDLTNRTGSVTVGIGGKYTLGESEGLKFRVSLGVTGEKDFSTPPGAPDLSAVVITQVIVEIDPLEKKK
jgi:RHS repeat-associated protein